MSAKLGVPVIAVDSAESAARGRQVVATASNARTADPILLGSWLQDCRLLCAVGNTRPAFAEIDTRCFADAALVVVDSLHAIEEAGDLRQAVAANVLPESKRTTLAQIVEGKTSVPARGLVVFKSVGTALQDLALATRYYELLKDKPGTATGPEIASLRDKAKRKTPAS
jgi:ornithine cyclodeaminase/alanine dehydrogenase-like protein (mu-crystallin family)